MRLPRAHGGGFARPCCVLGGAWSRAEGLGVPQFLFLLSAPRDNAVVHPCAFAVCPCALSPHYLSLFIAYLLFSHPHPHLYLISTVPHAALGPRGSRLPSRHQSWHLLPSGLADPVTSKRCPL